MLIKNLAKLGNPARNATSASLIFIAAVAMYRWAITPQSGYLAAAKGYESVMNKVIEQNKITAVQVEARRKKLKELRESSTQLQSTLFTDDQAKEFFSDLQVISEQAGCAVQSTYFVAEKSKSENEHLGIETKSANISVVGLYQDIERLIGRLQARTQKVWIDSIRMRTLDESSDSIICDLTITICQIKESISDE
jgi:Tfp pilus assembly protein PilO